MWGKEEDEDVDTRDKSSQMNQAVGEMTCRVVGGLHLAIDQDDGIISDSESHYDDIVKPRCSLKRPWVNRKANLPSSRPPHAGTTPISARDESKEHEVLCKWYVESEMLSENMVPLAVHFLERLGQPWLLLAPSMGVVRTQLMCFASCLWVAVRLTENPATLDRACVLLPKCTGIPHRFVKVAEAHLQRLFRWQIGGEGHGTSP